MAPITREMMAALEADAEKLRHLTGTDHRPIFLTEPNCPDCNGHGFKSDGTGSLHECGACGGTGTINKEAA
jgi:DnaJ-class molecular chaperone